MFIRAHEQVLLRAGRVVAKLAIFVLPQSKWTSFPDLSRYDSSVFSRITSISKHVARICSSVERGQVDRRRIVRCEVVGLIVLARTLIQIVLGQYVLIHVSL